MNEEKSAAASMVEEIDYSGRPFDYRDMDSQTAMVCENDPATRQKICETLKSLDFNVIEPATSKEALKYFTFHTFNLIVINENFNIGKDGVNYVLNHLEHLSMSIRRKIFVVLISSIFATMDDMHAYNKSINLIINKEEIAETGLILKKEIEENNYFYHVFNEIHRKYGKV
jgi:response regulator RpfG family c-di-GMP phosphodiesterase